MVCFLDGTFWLLPCSDSVAGDAFGACDCDVGVCIVEVLTRVFASSLVISAGLNRAFFLGNMLSCVTSQFHQDEKISQTLSCLL